MPSPTPPPGTEPSLPGSTPPPQDPYVRRGGSKPESEETIIRPEPLGTSVTREPPVTDSGVFRAPSPELPPEAAGAGEAARFGKFIRTVKLGAGGMGEVWKAWDTQVGRWVALKFLSGGEETEISRFVQEAHVAGRLSHPNIAAVYEVGQERERWYIAMQYVDGVTASKMPRGDRKALVRVVRDAARALDEAHRHGVIHRDVKPDNMMVRERRARGAAPGEAAGAPQSGSGIGEWHVYVMDFGLARRTEAASGLSVSGAVIGTPSYMSPEQSRGEKNVDARADVYSLGATLFELLAGRPPFEGNSIFEVLKAVQDGEAPSLRRFVPAIEPDLDTVVLKCLEKDRGRRYQTAADLADDLQRFLDHEPIAARPASLVYVVSRRLWKKRALVGVVGVALVAVGVLLGTFVPALLGERERRAETEGLLDLWVKISGLLNDAEVLSRAGKNEAARKKIDEGAVICREHLRTKSTADGHYFLARLMESVGRREEALHELDTALSIRADMREARVARGILRAELFQARAIETGRAIMLARGDIATGAVASLDDVVQKDPELDRLARMAEEDLKDPIGETKYFKDADVLYAQAVLAVVRQQAAEAEAKLHGVLDADPSYARAWYRLSNLYRDAGRWDEAVACARRMADIHRGRPEAHLMIAVSLVGKATRLPPTAEKKQVLEEALASSRRALAEGYAGAEVYTEIGASLIFLGRPKEALEQFDLALAIAPNLVVAYANKAVASHMAGDLSGARAAAEEALRRSPNARNVRVTYGHVLSDLGERHEAEAAYLKVLEDHPKYADAWFYIGLTRNEAGRLADAREAYGRAIAMNPGHSRSLNNRGKLLYDAKDVEGAFADFDAACKADAWNVSAHFNRGLVWFKREKWSEAEADFDRALAIEPGKPDALFKRGETRLERRNIKGATADFTALIEAKQFLDEAYYGRGNCHADGNDLKKACSDWRKCVAQNPKHIEAWNNLGAAYTMRGKPDDAEKAYDALLGLQPDDPTWLACRGEARLRQKKYSEAVADFRRALHVAPEGWEQRGAVEQRLKVAESK